MEKPTESHLEKNYYIALKNIESNLRNYALLLRENIAGGESTLQLSEYLDFKRGCLDGVVDHFLRAVKIGGEMNILKPSDQVFFQFRNFFQNLDVASMKREEIKKDMEEILRRVGAEQKLDFPEAPEAPEAPEEKNNLIEVDFKEKKRL